VFADRGYDHDKYRAQVKARGIRPVIACRGTPHGSGLGVYRYVVEQAIALLHWFRRRHARVLPPVPARRFGGKTRDVRSVRRGAKTGTSGRT